MDEYFLQYLWKHQKFETFPLRLTDGSALAVHRTGFQNYNAGPDFLEAKLKIEELEWIGSVEVHHKSSDWYRHHHDENRDYENVILHVVYTHDQEIKDHTGKPLPTFEISSHANSQLEQTYRAYINQPKTLRCEQWIANLDQIQITSMLDKALTGKLEAKTRYLLEIGETKHFDWDEISYLTLARNFGFSTNSHPFETLGGLLPFQVLRKHLHNPTQALALIFGTAGMLNETDEYATTLLKEYEFLKAKYRLRDFMSRHQWKFSKLRPPNFPTVRLAQFTFLLMKLTRPFDKFIADCSYKELLQKLKIETDEYWKTHYDFGKKLAQGTNTFGTQSIENLVINTVVPVQSAFSKYTNDPVLLANALNLLSSIKAENNKITRAWKEIDIPCNNAYDSQALIYQYKTYCEAKKCLQCNIGVAILQK